MINNYIFDFDGTLADTAGGIVATMQETFRQHGLSVPSEEEVRYVIGLPLHACMKKLGIDSDTMADELCATYRKLFYEIGMEYMEIFPEVKETLTKLLDKGKRLAIATSRSETSLRMIMQRHGMNDFFSEIISSTDQLPCKPAPDMVLAIMERMGLSETETMVIGDTTFDIEMGNAAHCWTSAVTYGNHNRERLLTANPNFIIDKFSELLKYNIGAQK